METSREAYSEAREQLEREATITFTATATLPDGTTADVSWPEDWEAPTWEHLDSGGSEELRSDAMELGHQAVLKLATAKLGPPPPPNETDIANIRATMIADPQGIVRPRPTLM